MHEAIASAPTLAQLADRARASEALLRVVQPLLPAALRSTVQAGPVDGAEWCLLVGGNAAAAKIRQMLPDLIVALNQRGNRIDQIRLKLVTPTAASASTPVAAPPSARR